MSFPCGGQRIHKNTSVFPQGDLSHAEVQRCGAGGPRSVAAAIDRKSWKRVRLGDILQVCHGKCQHAIESKTGKYPILATSGEIGRTALYLYDKPSVLIGRKGTIDKPQYIDSPFWTIDTLFYTKIAEDYNPKFLYYLCLTIDWASMNEASGVPSLSANRIESLEVTIPGVDEQDKIAHTLSSIDTHIATLQSLITKYEAIKKATVNLLLKPKENWRRVKLGDVCFAFSYGVGASAIPYDGINRYIRITDIDDDSHEFRPSPLSSPSHFNHDHIVNEGDILIARTGASVGKSYIYHPNDGKLVFAGFLIRAAINHDIADPYFIFLQTLTDKYRQWVAEESMRSGQPGLNIDQCKDFEFCIPKMSEQHKIAAQINEIDAVLNNCKKQLDKAQNLKQGMMSYFFG